MFMTGVATLATPRAKGHRLCGALTGADATRSARVTALAARGHLARLLAGSIFSRYGAFLARFLKRRTCPRHMGCAFVNVANWQHCSKVLFPNHACARKHAQHDRGSKITRACRLETRRQMSPQLEPLGASQPVEKPGIPGPVATLPVWN